MAEKKRDGVAWRIWNEAIQLVRKRPEGTNFHVQCDAWRVYKCRMDDDDDDDDDTWKNVPIKL